MLADMKQEKKIILLFSNPFPSKIELSLLLLSLLFLYYFSQSPSKVKLQYNLF